MRTNHSSNQPHHSMLEHCCGVTSKSSPTFLCLASLSLLKKRSGSQQLQQQQQQCQQESSCLFHSMGTPANSEIYQLINREGNGLLLNLYLSFKDRQISETDFKAHLKSLILPFLYNKGRGQLVTPEQWMSHFGSDYNRDLRARRRLSSRASSNPAAGDEAAHASLRDGNDVLDTSADQFQLNSFLTLTTHMACWKLELRGNYGETPLHFCYFLNTPEHLAIAGYLLELFPKLAVDRYEGSFYFGQNCLHFCITHANFSAIEKLLDCGADVNSRASGSFFIPHKLKSKSTKPVLLPDYQGQSYFGEYPLVFSACLEHYSIFDLLYRDERTNPNFQDIFGNTLAHLLVIHNKPRFLYYALKLPQKRIDLSIVNQNGLTPLQLACHLGYYEAFQVLADARSQLKWRFGHLESRTYLIDQLDSLNCCDGSINWNSALHLLCMGSTPGHTDIINRNPLVDSLLRAKWQTYVKQKFGFNLILSILYLLILISALYLRPSNQVMTEESLPSSVTEEKQLSDMIKIICELTLFGWSFLSIPYEWGLIFLEGSKHLSKDRIKSNNSPRGVTKNSHLTATLAYLKMVLGFKDKLAANIGSLLLILTGLARIFEAKTVEDVCLAISIPFLFGNLLFYCRCFSQLGPFITIYYHMIRKVLIKIIIMFFIVTLGSHCVLFFLFNFTLTQDEDEEMGQMQKLLMKTSGDNLSTVNNGLSRNSLTSAYIYRVAEIFIFLFHCTFGEIDMGLIEFSAYPTTGRLVLVQHGIMVTILLGCLMTGMVCATYQQVVLSFRAENKKQWARIILLLEAQMSKGNRRKGIREYTNGRMLTDPACPSWKSFGLVVTTIRDISDACRRNRAWHNWRKLKYELYKRRFVVHDSTVTHKKLAQRTKKSSSCADPFMIEQLKEKRRRVSVNTICRTTPASSLHTSGLKFMLHEETITGLNSASASGAGNQDTETSSEYSEIHTPPLSEAVPWVRRSNGSSGVLSPISHFAITNIPEEKSNSMDDATMCL